MSDLIARRMSVPFHLVISTAHEPAQIARPRSQWLRSFRILPVENRGRDVLPFLRALAGAPPFEIGLKIHTKKSPQRTDGARWLKDVLESLLPSRSGIRAIVGKIGADPRIGFVAPSAFCLPVQPWVLQNGEAMRTVMGAVGHHLTDADMTDAYFAAGNMFWFRHEALRALATERISDLFEPEAAQLDGTIAHAMERVFPIEAHRKGFLTVAMPALMNSGPEHSREDIIDATRRHADLPNALFPAPYEAPVPTAPAVKVQERLLRSLLPYARVIPSPLRRLIVGVVRGDKPTRAG